MTYASRNTTTGLKFQNNPITFHTHLHPKGTLVSGHEIYHLACKKLGIPYSQYTQFISKRIIPDECYLDLKNKTFTAYEKKSQNGGGSADEKLQTCAYKIRQIRKVCKIIGIPSENVKYIYTLDKWFKDDKYKDSLEYIKEVPGCDYEILGGE